MDFDVFCAGCGWEGKESDCALDNSPDYGYSLGSSCCPCCGSDAILFA